jgi:hypothetical protein
MQTYITINDTIKHTDADGVIRWIPKDEGNIDYQVFLQHTETAADKTAQRVHDAEQAALDNAAQVKAEANATAKAALLARLGITADEAKLLLGGN